MQRFSFGLFTVLLLSAASIHASAEHRIVVSDAAELRAALVPENAGAHILALAGDYPIDAPLAVPDGATLAGEGVMQLGADRIPSGAGFAPGTATVIRAASAFPGDLVTLGDGARLKRLSLEDLAGRAGNVVMLGSRGVGDRVSATISDCELVTPNAPGIGPNAPTGAAFAVLAGNPRVPVDLPPHAGAFLAARVERSILRGRNTVWASNFASDATIEIQLGRNLIAGGVIANGGVSRPDAVAGSLVSIRSNRNLYLGSGGTGWQLYAGSPAATTALGQLPATERNTLAMRSVGDRLVGFATGVLATAANRFFASPQAGPSSDNRLELTLLNAQLDSVTSDLNVSAGRALVADTSPGDGNVARLVLRGVRGSSAPSSFVAVAGPAGPVLPGLEGTGNALEIVGSPKSFAATNPGIVPLPAPELFTRRP